MRNKLLHLIQVKKVSSGYKVKIKSLSGYGSITIDKGNHYHAIDVAIEYLMGKGFDIIGVCEGNFVVSNTFKPLESEK